MISVLIDDKKGKDIIEEILSGFSKLNYKYSL